MPPVRWLLVPILFACAAGQASKPQPAAPATIPPAALTTWANGAVFYEVFVRSFQDSNGDGRGDLKGLISRLDYLNDGDASTTQDLGVDALWLMPVFASPSYHGYDTVDYENVNPDYGSSADLETLFTEAHRRGMRVILDLVLNHTGSGHPWFVDSASSPASAHRDWYVWSPTDPGWRQPWNASSGSTWYLRNGAFYYGVFWSGMPDLNFRTAAVRDELKRIAKLWLDRGADGFRLDAVRYFVEDGPGAGQADTPGTHQFLQEFAAFVRGVKPDAAVVGEAWTDTPIIARYYGSTTAVPGGDELPLAFDFPLAEQILKGIETGDAGPIAAKLAEIGSLYPAGATDAPFLTNHDQTRVATALASDPGRLGTAAALLLTLPGTPFLYYGEEIGMQNGPTPADEDKRTPMPWDGSPGGGFTTATPWHDFSPGHQTANVAAQSADPASLLSRYRKLIAARHASAALGHGGLAVLLGDGPVLAFLREQGSERVLVAHNLGGGQQTAAVAVVAGGAEPLFADAGVAFDFSGGSARVSLPPHASAVLRLR